MRILVLGVSGMLGHILFRVFNEDPRLEVWGTLRQASGLVHFTDAERRRLLDFVDVLDQDALLAALGVARPEIVVNCVGLIKQLAAAGDPLRVIPINAMLPHRLARICAITGMRLIHISTDCVFSGGQGHYSESDPSDAQDLYGRSKHMGEVVDEPHVVTLRTSIIGHELASRNGLVEWFLSQTGSVKGYAKVVFSGLPTAELARVIRDLVLPRPNMRGLYHLSSAAITKYDLLKLIAKVYRRDTEILRDEHLVLDRSLNSERFTRETGYVASAWPELIRDMQRGRQN